MSKILSVCLSGIKLLAPSWRASYLIAVARGLIKLEFVRRDASIMIEPEECPVCLEEQDEADVIRLPCTHVICRPCIAELWEVQQSSVATWKDGHLTCPMCRASHPVGNYGLNAFLVEACGAESAHERHVARPATPRQPAAPKEGLEALTIAELKTVARTLSIEIATLLEREHIEAAVRERAADGLGSLPARSLKAILEVRMIPYDDCVEKEELVGRCVHTHRGSCMELPPRLLRRMLEQHGLGGEAPGLVEKTALARRVMAARALAQQQALAHANEARARGLSPRGDGDGRAGGGDGGGSFRPGGASSRAGGSAAAAASSAAAAAAARVFTSSSSSTSTSTSRSSSCSRTVTTTTTSRGGVSTTVQTSWSSADGAAGAHPATGAAGAAGGGASAGPGGRSSRVASPRAVQLQVEQQQQRQQRQSPRAQQQPPPQPGSETPETGTPPVAGCGCVLL